MKQRHGTRGTGSMLEQKDRERESSGHVGSLGGLMNQGSSYDHANDHTLPQIMNQGASDKRDPVIHAPLRRAMGQ